MTHCPKCNGHDHWQEHSVNQFGVAVYVSDTWWCPDCEEFIEPIEYRKEQS